MYLKDHNERLKEDIQLNVDSEWTQMGRNKDLSLFEPFFMRQPLGMRLFIKKQTRYYINQLLREVGEEWRISQQRTKLDCLNLL